MRGSPCGPSLRRSDWAGPCAGTTGAVRGGGQGSKARACQAACGAQRGAVKRWGLAIDGWGLAGAWRLILMKRGTGSSDRRCAGAAVRRGPDAAPDRILERAFGVRPAGGEAVGASRRSRGTRGTRRGSRGALGSQPPRAAPGPGRPAARRAPSKSLSKGAARQGTPCGAARIAQAGPHRAPPHVAPPVRRLRRGCAAGASLTQLLERGVARRQLPALVVKRLPGPADRYNRYNRSNRPRSATSARATGPMRAWRACPPVRAARCPAAAACVRRVAMCGGHGPRVSGRVSARTRPASRGPTMAISGPQLGGIGALPRHPRPYQPYPYSGPRAAPGRCRLRRPQGRCRLIRPQGRTRPGQPGPLSPAHPHPPARGPDVAREQHPIRRVSAQLAAA